MHGTHHFNVCFLSMHFKFFQVLDGERVRSCQPKEEEMRKILKAVGSCVGRLHDADVVHGDLTSSNVLITTPSQVIVEISCISSSVLPGTLKCIMLSAKLVDFCNFSGTMFDRLWLELRINYARG